MGFYQKKYAWIAVVALIILSPANCFSAMSSSSYQIDTDVLSGGGSTTSSGNYEFGDTLGESFIGDSTSANYNDGAGFWFLNTGDSQLGLFCEVTGVTEASYTLGNENNYSQYTFTTNEECMVDDNWNEAWDLTVQSTNMVGPKNNIPNTNIFLVTDGNPSSGSTITSPATNLTETSGNYSLNTPRSIVHGTSSAAGLYYTRPTIRITNLNTLYAETMTATLTFNLL